MSNSPQSDNTNFGYFTHERLDVYQVSREFLRWCQSAVVPRLRGKAWLKDQLLRAASSVVLNIAEGASQHSAGMKRRHFEIALGSAGECAAALDVASDLGVQIEGGHALIARVGAMLSRLTARYS